MLKMIEIVTDLKRLREISRATSRDEVEQLCLKKQIIEAERHSWSRGAGLAAVQIGFPLRYAYLRYKDREVELINSIILEKKGYIICPGEGCLSIPNQRVTTERYNIIKVDTEGDGKKIYEFTGFVAQIVQHEIDHFEGILNIDRQPKSTKVGRNELCPCGSGKKYKKCCGGSNETGQTVREVE